MNIDNVFYGTVLPGIEPEAESLARIIACDDHRGFKCFADSFKDGQIAVAYFPRYIAEHELGPLPATGGCLSDKRLGPGLVIYSSLPPDFRGSEDEYRQRWREVFSFAEPYGELTFPIEDLFLGTPSLRRAAARAYVFEFKAWHGLAS